MAGILAGLIGSLKAMLTFTVRSMPSGSVWRGGVYFGGKIYVFGGTGTTYYYSSDEGVNWTAGTLPSSVSGGRAATNGSRIVLTDFGGSSVFYSDNGTSWTSVSGGTSARDIMYANGYFTIVTTSTTANGFRYSTDGASWTSYDIGSGGNSIAYDSASSQYFATRGDLLSGTGIYYRPLAELTTASGWSSVNTGQTGVWMTVAAGNGIIAAARATTSASQCIAISSNGGSTWTTVTPPRTYVASNGYIGFKMYFHNGYFYVVKGAAATGSPHEIIRTADFITFERIEIDTTGVMDSWVFVPNSTKLYVFGADGSSSNSEFLKIDGV